MRGWKVCGRAAALVEQQQVEGQRHPVAGADRAYLVPAVRVEGRVAERAPAVARRQVVHRLPARVLHAQLAALVAAGQQQHQRAEHPLLLLTVLVRREEAAGLVHQQLVQLTAHVRGGRQSAEPQSRAEPRHDDVAELCEQGRVDCDGRRVDLPRVAHGGVEHSVGAAAERRLRCHCDELAALRGGDGEAQSADSRDLHERQQRQRRDDAAAAELLRGAPHRRVVLGLQALAQRIHKVDHG